MKTLRNLILGITGLVSILPGYLIFTESKLMPPTSDFKSLLFIVSEFIAFMIIILTLINRGKLSKISVIKSNIILILTTSIFIISIFCYSYYFSELIVKDSYGAIILPLYETQSLIEKKEMYGSIINFFRETDSVTLNEYFGEHKDIQRAIFHSYLLLYFFFILSIGLLVFSSIFASIRLKSTRINLN